MNSTECLICYEKIKTNNCCVTECNHVFCLTCMIKTALKKKECPYCREKILKNKETGEEEEVEEESGLEELVVNENYTLEVEVQVFGDIEFSEESDSDYQPENNNRDLSLIAFSSIGYLTYSYLKEIIEISIYKYLFYKNHHIDYINKFKNCDFELFKEIPLFFGYSIECNNNEKIKVYDLFFKETNDVYAFATSGSEFEQDKNIEKKNKKKLIKKNKSKKINKEKINKNRCLKF